MDIDAPTFEVPREDVQNVDSGPFIQEYVGAAAEYGRGTTFMERFDSDQYACHETTTRAARLERGILVTLIQLASSERDVRGYRHGNREDFATLPPMKGPMGFVHVEA
jgi:hypothetical protein